MIEDIEFGILDSNGNRCTNVAAAFKYRGFVIVFDNDPDVAVYLDTIMTRVKSVQCAINWCNQNQDKKY